MASGLTSKCFGEGERPLKLVKRTWMRIQERGGTLAWFAQAFSQLLPPAVVSCKIAEVASSSLFFCRVFSLCL